MKRFSLIFISILTLFSMAFIIWFCGEDLYPPQPEVELVETPEPDPTLTKVNPLGPIITVSNLVEDQHVYRDFNKIVGQTRDPDGVVNTLQYQVMCGDYVSELIDVANFTAGQQKSNWYYNEIDFSDTAVFPGGPDYPVKFALYASDDNLANYGGPITNTYYVRVYIDNPPDIETSFANDTTINLSPTNQVYWIEGTADDDFNTSSLKYSFDMGTTSLEVDILSFTEELIDPPGALTTTDIEEEPTNPGVYKLSFSGSPDFSQVTSGMYINITGTSNFNNSYKITNVDEANLNLYFKSSTGLGSETGLSVPADISEGVYVVQLDAQDLSNVIVGQSIIITGDSNFSGIKTITDVDDDNDRISIVNTAFIDTSFTDADGIITSTTNYIDSAESWKIPIAYYDYLLYDGDHTVYIQSFDDEGQESPIITRSFTVTRTGARYRVREGNGSGLHYLNDENPDAGNCYAVVDTSLFSMILSALGSPVGIVSDCTPENGISSTTDVDIDIDPYSINLIPGSPINVDYENITVTNWDDVNNATINGDVVISLAIDSFGNISIIAPITNGSIFNEGDAITISIEDMLSLTVALDDIVGNPHGVDTSAGPISIGLDGIHIEGWGSLGNLLGMDTTFDISILLDVGIDLESMLMGLINGGGFDLDMDSMLGQLDLTLALMESQTASGHPAPSKAYNMLSIDLGALGLDVGGMALDALASIAIDSSNFQIILKSDTDGGYPYSGDPASCGADDVCKNNHGYSGVPNGFADIYVNLNFIDYINDGGTDIYGIAVEIPQMFSLGEMDFGTQEVLGFIELALGAHDIWLKTKSGKPIHNTDTFSLTLNGFLDIGSFAVGFPQYWNNVAQGLGVTDVTGSAEVRLDPPLDITLDVGPGWFDIDIMSIEFTSGEILDDSSGPGTSNPKDIIVDFGYGLFDGGAPLNETMTNPITGAFYEGYYAGLELNIDSLQVDITIPLLAPDGIDLNDLFGMSLLPTPLLETIIPITTMGGDGGLY